LILSLCLVALQGARASETPPLQFVTEYVRGFAAVEHIRLAEEREMQAPHQSMLATCIESGNRYRAELTQQIAHMRGMTVRPPSQALPAHLVELYGQKLALYDEIVTACTSLGSGADANVSSLEVMGAVLRYDAKVDAIDRSLFQTSTQVFYTLLSSTPGIPDKARRLTIALAEKQTLMRQIQLGFGAELEDEQQTYLVNAATVIRDYLRAHKAADET
jgi:hypothetical protein